ncbi:hypothetical protein Tco_0272718 [Tanacetum coccineum]
MKKTNSENQYAVSIKEDTAYLCLHFDHEGNKINTPYPENPIRRIPVIECEDSGRYRTCQTAVHLQPHTTLTYGPLNPLASPPEAKEPARIDDPEDAGSSS